MEITLILQPAITPSYLHSPCWPWPQVECALCQLRADQRGGKKVECPWVCHVISRWWIQHKSRQQRGAAVWRSKAANCLGKNAHKEPADHVAWQSNFGNWFRIWKGGSRGTGSALQGKYHKLVEAQKSKPFKESKNSSGLPSRSQSVMDVEVHNGESGMPAVQFCDVHFCYPTQTIKVFWGLNLSIY